MPISDGDRAAVEGYYKAMRLGSAGVSAITELFTDDAVYIEPFSGGDGRAREHVGKSVIGEFLKDSINHRPADMVVTMERLDAEAGRVRAEWICTAAVFPQPMCGIDLYEMRDCKIARLETRLR